MAESGMKWTPDDWARLGGRIKAARSVQGESRRALAARAGVSEKSVQLTEEGRVPVRWPKSLYSIENALGWPTGMARWILNGGDPDKNPPPEPDVPLVSLADIEESKPVIPVVFRWYLEMQGVKAENLPPRMVAALPMLADFNDQCVEQDVPQELTLAFFNTLSVMLKSATDNFQSEKARRARRTPEQIEAEHQADRVRIREEWQFTRDKMERALDELHSNPDGSSAWETSVRSLEEGMKTTERWLQAMDEKIEKKS